MISYDQYLNRIQKAAKVKKFVHRFRFLIIGVFSLIIAATSGLLIAKGTVTTAMTLLSDDPIYFGDSYAFSEATAFLSSVSYEYSLEGTDVWTEEKPIKAGKYLARAVTDKAVGKGYSAPVRFEILPRPARFTIGASSVVYGSVPGGCSVSGLIFSDHRLVTADLKFEYESYTATRTQVEVVPSTVKITDGKGEDFTACYDITYTGKELDITPRAVTIQPKGLAYTYSGSEAAVTNELTEGSKTQLAYGDEITVTTAVVGNVAPVNARSYPLEITGFTVMHGGDDVTHQYDVKTLTAQLVISPRPITVTTAGAAKEEYDGTYIQNTSAPVASNLVAGHTLVVPSGFTYPARKDAGTEENKVDFLIMNGDEDVTKNYAPELKWGMLTVGRRSITIKTPTRTEKYTAQALSDVTPTIDRLVAGHYAENINTVSIINAGSVKNEIRYNIFDGEGNLVTGNYAINYDWGTLTVTQLSVVITTLTDSKVYDGTPLKSAVIKAEGLLLEHEVYALSPFSVRNVKDSGRDNTEYRIRETGGYGQDVTGNYSVHVNYGTLTVTKRPIVVTAGTSTAHFTFDGEEHSYPYYETRYDGNSSLDGLVAGDRLTVLNATTGRNAGTYTNTFTVTDNSGNYQIVGNVISGAFTIDPRPIVIKTKTDSRVYNGQPFANSTITAADTYLSGNQFGFGLLTGDEKYLLCTKETSITNAGWVDNICQYSDQSGNYKITEIRAGKLTVTKRPVTVRLLPVTVTYGEDDKIVYPAGRGNIANLSSCDLVPGEEIEVFAEFVGIYSGIYNPKGTYAIRADEARTEINGNTAGAKNYSVTYIDGTLTVNPRPITIKTQNQFNIVYDGMPHYSRLDQATSTVNNPLAGHTINTANLDSAGRVFSVTDVKDSRTDATVYMIWDTGGGRYVTDNYEISYDYGYIEVIPRPVTVVIGNKIKTYDCKPVYFAEAPNNFDNAAVIDLASGESLQVAIYYTTDSAGQNTIPVTARFNAGTYYIQLDRASSRIYQNGAVKAGGIDNYTISYTAAKLVIDTVKVTVTQNDLTSITYGEYATYNGFTTSPSKERLPSYNGVQDTVRLDYYLLLSGGDGTHYSVFHNLHAGSYLVCTDEGSVRVNAGNSTEDVSGNYSFVGFTNGELTVNRREVTVTINPFTSTYGNDHAALYAALYGAENCYTAVGPNGGQALVFGDKLEVFVNILANSKTPVKTHAGVIVLDYYQVNGVKNDTSDYVFHAFNPGALTIVPAPLSIELTDLNRLGPVYYGETLAYPAGKGNYERATGLANGEQLEVGVYFEKDFTRVEPKNAGTYTVKFDKESTFVYSSDGNKIEEGINNYTVTCAESSATIRQKIVTLTLIYDSEIVYGEEFVLDYTYEKLPYGETISVGFVYSKDGVSYSSPQHAGTYYIFRDPDNCFAYAEDGSLIRFGFNNYVVRWEPGYATVTVTPRPVTVYLLDLVGADGVEYGENISAALYPDGEENYKLAYGLLPGDKLTVSVSIELLTWRPGVGVYYGVILPDDAEVTTGSSLRSDYKIDYKAGDLEIVRRRIVVTNTGASKVYDGTALTNGAYTTLHTDGVRAGLVYGDTLTLIGSLTEITDYFAGGIANANRYSAGSNYDIVDYIDGMLVIEKRTIYVVTKDEEYVYNGETRYSSTTLDTAESYHWNATEGIKERALVFDSHHFAVTDPVCLKNVGWLYNVALENCRIYNGEERDENDVTDNYEVRDEQRGKLIITPRLIVVKTATISKPYDGTDLFGTDEPPVTYLYQEGLSKEQYGEGVERGLLGTDAIWFDFKGTVAWIRNVWENAPENNKTDYTTALDFGETRNDAGLNYEIVFYIYGTLTIEERPVTIQLDLGTDSAAYGDDFFVPEIGKYYRVTGGSLAEGEALLLAIHFVDEKGITFASDARLPAGKYTVVLDIEDCLVYSGNTVVPYGIKNYAVTAGEDITITIGGKAVTVTLNPVTAIYGNGLTDNEGFSGFAELEELGNEILTFEYAYFYKDEGGSFVSVSTLARISVGTYYVLAIKGTEKVTGADGRDVTGNYAFTFIEGTVTVLPREVTVTPHSFGVGYGEDYGYPYTGAGNYASAVGPEGAVGLVYGDTLEISVRYTANGSAVFPAEFPYTRIFAGTHAIEIDGFTLYELGAEADNRNYIFLSADGTLSVTPREISFSLVPIEDATYGTNRTYPSGVNSYIAEDLEMGYGEYLEVRAIFYHMSGGNMDYTGRLNAGSYEVRFMLIHVYADKWCTQLISGGENNYTYDIPESLAFTVFPKAVTVTLKDSRYVYGELAPAIDFDADGLEYGEKLTFAGYYYDGETAAPVNAGRYALTVDETLVLIDGYAAGADNYTFSFTGARLTIEQRRITVKTADRGFTYDGNEHYDNTFESTALNGTGAGFVYGDMPEISADAVRKVTHVSEGAVENIFSIPYSENYILEGVDYGYIWIEARQIVVELRKDLKIVYGEPFTYPAGDESYAAVYTNTYPREQGLVGEDTLEVFIRSFSAKAIPDAQTYTLLLDKVLINGEELTDLSDYKLATYMVGQLVIAQRKIVVVTQDEEHEYNGQRQYSSTQVDDEESYYLNERTGERERALLEGHFFDMSGTVSLVNVGSVPNSALANSRIYDGAGGDVTDNYTIDSERTGRFIITPRHIAVATPTLNKEYDGTYLYGDSEAPVTYYYRDGEIVYGERGLVGTDMLLVSTRAAVRYFWESPVANTTRYISPLVSAAAEPRDDAGYNYIIEEYIDGTLTIEQCKIELEIDLGEREKAYGDTVFQAGYGKNYQIVKGSLASGESLYIAIHFVDESGKIYPSSARLPVGRYTAVLEIENCEVYQGSRPFANGIQNYILSAAPAEIIVNKLSLKITQNNITVIYGDGIVYNGFSTNPVRLPALGGVRDRVELSYYFTGEDDTPITPSERLAAGTYRVCTDEGSVRIFNANGEDVTANYDLAFEHGTLTVNKRRILITTSSASKPYDGTELMNTEEPTVTMYVGGRLDEAGMTEWDSITFDGWPSITEVGTIPNSCTYTISCPENYSPTFKPGELKITAAPLTVEFSAFDNVLPYGQTFSYPDRAGNYQRVFRTIDGVIHEGLVEGETLTLAVYFSTDSAGNVRVNGTPKNAGVYYLHIDLDRTSIPQTKNGIFNYNVSYEPPVAEITKLTLNVVLERSVFTYNGEAREYGGFYTLEDGALAYGESLVVAALYLDAEGNVLEELPVDAGSYRIRLDVLNSTIDNGDAATLNYEFVPLCLAREYDFIIEQAKFTVKLSDIDGYVYDGAAIDFEATGNFEVEGLFGTDKLVCGVVYYYRLASGERGEMLAGAPRDAGKYIVVFDHTNIVFSSGKAENYAFDDTTGAFSCSLTILPRDVKITVNYRGDIEYADLATADPAAAGYRHEWIYNGVATGYMGFVAGDLGSITAEYYYLDSEGNRVAFENLTQGEYTVWIAFSGDVLSNYNIVDMVEGTLKIVGKKVIVTAFYKAGEDMTYNASAVDIDALLDMERIGFTHTHAGTDGTGFDSLEGLTVTFTFRRGTSTYQIAYLIEGGAYVYKSGTGPVNAGKYTVSVEISGYPDFAYEVEYRNAETQLEILKKEVTVTTVLPEVIKDYDKKAIEGFVLEYSGLVQADIDRGVKVVLGYIDRATGYVSTGINAGSYDVIARISVAAYENNYTVLYTKGSLRVDPITVYIKPVPKAEYYRGQNLTLTALDYEFVDASHAARMVGGDTIYVTDFSTWSLDPTKSILAFVTIRGVAVRDGGTDVTGNYRVFYAYDSKEMAGTDLSTGTFSEIIEYKTRTVSYSQSVPAGQREYLYDGESKSVSGSNLFNILGIRGAEGAISYTASRDGGLAFTVTEGSFTYRIVGTLQSVGPQTGTYTNWLNLRVYDGDKDITLLFNLKLTSDGTSALTIAKYDLTLTIVGLNASDLENGGVFYTSSFDGRKALNTAYYRLQGLMEGKEHLYEVITVKSRGEWNFIIVVYERSASGLLSDRSDIYNLKEVKYENCSALDVVYDIMDCHSLALIPIDITLELKNIDYATLEKMAAGEGENRYEYRPALKEGEQYTIGGLLPGHEKTEVVVVRSKGYITLVVLVFDAATSGPRSYLYNLMFTPPVGFGPVRGELAGSLIEVPQDVTVTFEDNFPNLAAAGSLVEFEGRWVLNPNLYAVRGLIADTKNPHSVQIMPVQSGGKLTFAVMIYSGSTTQLLYYLYNLVVENAPAIAEDIFLAIMVGDIDLNIALKETVTAAALRADVAAVKAGGVGTIVTRSEIDGRLILAKGAYEIETLFQKDVLTKGDEVEIVVEVTASKVQLFVIVFARSSVNGALSRMEKLLYYNPAWTCADGTIKIESTFCSLLGDYGKI